MSDWDAILRNKNNSGGFAGRNQADEDDYFAFFAAEPAHAIRLRDLLDEGRMALRRFADWFGELAQRTT